MKAFKLLAFLLFSSALVSPMYQFYLYPVSIRDIISVANVLFQYDFASFHTAILCPVLKSKLKNGE